MKSSKEKVLEFWNERANHGANAGSNDFMLKELEERALLDRIPSKAKVLDIGCGNGATLLRLARDKGCSGVGIDYAASLLALANEGAGKRGGGSGVEFHKGDVLNLPSDLGVFDHVVTQRCLINLETLEEQERAFESILKHVAPGGRYYMIEAFNDGNRALNALREPFGLEPMTMPWHNRFFELKDVLAWQQNHAATVEEVAHFASTYYFLSRVVYAKLATDRGEELHYDSDINKLAIQLPAIGEFGATKLVVWKRTN